MSHSPPGGDGTTALLAGATGLVGGCLLEGLLASSRYRWVRVLARRPLDLDHPKLACEIVDFERLPGGAGSGGEVDEVFCALGTTLRTAGSQEAFRRVDHDYVVALGRLARSLGARHFLLVSSLGADPGARQFYLRVKGETEDDLESLGLPRLSVFRPSLLVGERSEFRLGEKVGQLTAGLIRPLLPARLKPVQADELAAAMLRVAAGDGDGVRIYESDEIRRLAAA